VSRNVRLSEAPSFGKPILFYDALSTGTHNYMELAKEVLERTAASRIKTSAAPSSSAV
jgi:chromosome partitioning protein